MREYSVNEGAHVARGAVLYRIESIDEASLDPTEPSAQQRLERLREARRVRAPFDGVLVRAAFVPGTWVREGETLLTLRPEGASLRGYLSVPSAQEHLVLAGRNLAISFLQGPSGQRSELPARVLGRQRSQPEEESARARGANDSQRQNERTLELAFESAPSLSTALQPGERISAELTLRSPRVVELLFSGR